MHKRLNSSMNIQKVDTLINDWNSKYDLTNFKGFVDETIRDGLQCIQLISTKDETKRDIIEYMNSIPLITDIIVGMIGISDESDKNLGSLLEYVDTEKLTPWFLCRLNLDDVKKAEKFIPYNVGINLFIAISDIRLYVEDWDFETILNNLIEVVRYCKTKFKYVRVALEDATRASSDKLICAVKKLTELEVDRIVIADTVGVATPSSIENIFEAIHKVIPDFKNLKTSFEWHGHNDRGLAVANSLTSIQCGVRYVHGTMLGIGERNGNANLDTMMCNLYENYPDLDWGNIKSYFKYCWERFRDVLNNQYPYYGKNSNKSSSGTHCSAIIKAIKKGDITAAKQVFSIITPEMDDDLVSRMVLSNISGKTMLSFIFESKGIMLNKTELTQMMNYLKSNRFPIYFDELYQKYKLEFSS